MHCPPLLSNFYAPCYLALYYSQRPIVIGHLATELIFGHGEPFLPVFSFKFTVLPMVVQPAMLSDARGGQ
jgi:hypothetical protein